MPKVEEWKRPEFMRILIHGETGTGKTYLAGTAALVPAMSPVLFFDFERGRSSVFNIPGISKESITFWDCTGPKDLNTLERATVQSGEFRTIIIDSLTEMYWLMMSIHLKEQSRQDSVPQIQDYGFISNRMMKFLRSLEHDAAVHIIATAGTALNKDELSGAIHQEPDILGKLNFRAPRFFDTVGFLSVSYSRPRGGVAKVARSLQVQPFRRVRAKDRSGKLGIVLEAPTMKKIYDLINQTS